MSELLNDPSFRAHMAALVDEPTHTDLLVAAVQFLRSGPSLHKVRVNGEMLDRAQVANGLEKYIPEGRR